MNTSRIFSYLLLFSLLSCLQAKGQLFKQYEIKKSKCQDISCNGFRINIFDRINSVYLFDTSHINYHHNLNISSSTRIRIIEELISIFEDDADICCLKVCNYSKTDKTSPASTHYTLQVESLFIINLLIFGDRAIYLAPFPVLMKGTTEINNNKSEVDSVYQKYKNWLVLSKKKKFSNFTFPLFNTNYGWYLGKGNSKTIRFSGMPQSKLSLFTGWCKE